MPFVKGQSGNPGGRPKNSLTEAIRRELARKSPDGPTYRVLIAQRLTMLAQAGNVDAIKIVLERMDGKVPDTVNLNQRQVVKAIDTEAWDSV